MDEFASGIDYHLLAAVSLGGITLDVLGGLYLAYDLLGGRRGPLRVIARIASYCVSYLLIFGGIIGLSFGTVAAIGLGTVLGIEYWRADAALSSDPSGQQGIVLLFGFCRGMVLGAAAGVEYGSRFGILFGVLSGIGLIAVYSVRFAPSDQYRAHAMPRLSRDKAVASFVRALAIAVGGAVAGLLLHQGVRFVLMGLKVGLAVGVASRIAGLFSPSIEWWADHLPGRRLGMFGLCLILVGMGMQALQYVVMLLDLPVR